MSTEPVLVGVIGGSGVYSMRCLENPTTVKIDTPFGSPSDEVVIATVRGVRCAFLPRHGRHHVFTPSEVNYQANIYAMKSLGVKYLMSITAVGSLDEDYQPGDLVLVDQIVDKTVARKSTFFGNGIVGHVPFGHPTCPAFRAVAAAAIKAALPDCKLHERGTLVTMEGPVFSTKAESLINKHQGAHLIGMTTATEAKLAREAEMAYITVSMVTDMDAWSDEPHVSVDKVMKTLKENGEKAQLYPPAVIEAIAKADATLESEAFNALQYAVMTDPAYFPAQRKEDMKLFLAKYPHYKY